MKLSTLSIVLWIIASLGFFISGNRVFAYLSILMGILPSSIWLIRLLLQHTPNPFLWVSAATREELAIAEFLSKAQAQKLISSSKEECRVRLKIEDMVKEELKEEMERAEEERISKALSKYGL